MGGCRLMNIDPEKAFVDGVETQSFEGCVEIHFLTDKITYA